VPVCLSAVVIRKKLPRPLIEGDATELGPWREIGGVHLCADLDGTNEVMGLEVRFA